MSVYATRFTGSRVIARASHITGWAEEMIIGPRRYAELSEIRFACMAAMRAKNMTLCQIGARLGGRNHQTVHAGIARAHILSAAPEYAALVQALEDE